MSFAHPAWLILLALPPLLGAAAVAFARLRGARWSAFTAPRLRGMLLKCVSGLPHWFALMFLLAALVAMIVAMARPQGDAGRRAEKSLGRNVLVALDLSRSMRVEDVKPDRLNRAKTILYELLEAMPNERIGVIGFAGSAYLYAPLTIDHRAVRETVEQINEEWVTRGGSNFGDALELAIETLRQTGQRNNALIVLSDGEKHDGSLDDLIEQAAEAGIRIVAIGVGTEDGDFVPNPGFPGGRLVDRNGQPVISRLQSEVLRQLASGTRGRYAPASGAGLADLVQDVIKDLDTFEIEGRERAIAVEFYQWLLLPAILFLMASVLCATRWRGLKPAFIVAALFFLPDAAEADSVSSAKRALRSGDAESAGETYRKLAESTPLDGRRARFRLGEAAAAFRADDFRRARSAYSQALQSPDAEVRRSAHDGIGRSLFQLGWLGLDENPYPSDPEALPTMEDFDALVREKLKAIRESEDDSADGMKQLRSLITNWTDAVRHFDSAGPQGAAQHNREVAMTYLKRLRELLEEEREQTEQSLPQEQPESGQSPEGQQEGESGEPREDGEQGEGEPREDGEQGEGEGEEPREDGSGDEERDSEGKRGEQEQENESGEKEGNDPNETPEERARRILGENADLEKGPLTPGRIEFNPPEKDW